MGQRFYVNNDFPTSPDTGPIAIGVAPLLKTQLSGLAQTATLRRGKVTQLKIGPISVPAGTDCNILYLIQRQSAADGSLAGVVTPIFLPAFEGGTAPVASSLWKCNYTSVEPTYAGRLWSQYLNQHSGFIWYAPDEIGIPWPALNNQGLAFMANSSNYTGFASWGVDFDE